jgi:hypothetical protein
VIQHIAADLVETDRCRSLSKTIWQRDFQDNLWHEICSEFDAARLAAYVLRAHVPLSDAFRGFETEWLSDERRHYLGFRHLYSTMYRISCDVVAARVEARPSSFDRLSSFLTDEFHLCVLLAYDEIVTARAYAEDFAIYDAFGDCNVSTWIRQVCRDEAKHFLGITRILRSCHAARLTELPRALDHLVAYDTSGMEYVGEFVLDHQQCSRELLERGRRAVLAACGRPAERG